MKNIKKKIVGYSNKISVRPQEKISFMISCDKKIKSIYSKFVKIIQGDCNPEGPGYKEELVRRRARMYARHDKKTLKESFRVFEQEPELISLAMQARQELELLLEESD
mgnify:CR=1 FL=1